MKRRMLMVLGGLLIFMWVRWTAVDPGATPAALSSVALRVHNADALESFYVEAFGAEFRTVTTGAVSSRFGELSGVTLKFVPIRGDADFDGFPVHQLGFEVDDLDAVVQAALRHGGRIEDPARVIDGRRVAAIRDPDGNTVELIER